MDGDSKCDLKVFDPTKKKRRRAAAPPPVIEKEEKALVSVLEPLHLYSIHNIVQIRLVVHA